MLGRRSAHWAGSPDRVGRASGGTPRGCPPSQAVRLSLSSCASEDPPGRSCLPDGRDARNIAPPPLIAVAGRRHPIELQEGHAHLLGVAESRKPADAFDREVGHLQEMLGAPTAAEVHLG